MLLSSGWIPRLVVLIVFIFSLCDSAKIGRSKPITPRRFSQNDEPRATDDENGNSEDDNGNGNDEDNGEDYEDTTSNNTAGKTNVTDYDENENPWNAGRLKF